MKRISIYDNNNCFQGWFDLDSARELAAIKQGSPYVYGRILFVTAQGKFVINDWSNTGKDSYRFADDKKEIAEILAQAGWNENNEKIIEIINKYEV